MIIQPKVNFTFSFAFGVMFRTHGGMSHGGALPHLVDEDADFVAISITLDRCYSSKARKQLSQILAIAVHFCLSADRQY